MLRRIELDRLLRSRDGNFGMMSALLMPLLLYTAGGAVDVYSAYAEKENMQGIADSAALAGGAVYNGTNSAAAIAQAESFLKGYKSKLLDGATYTVTMDEAKLGVLIQAKSKNNFLPLMGLNAIDVGVFAQSLAPEKPSKVEFTPTKAQGFYYKKVTIRVIRPGSTKEEIVGTVTYQPATTDDQGQGTMTVSPSTSIDLGKYSSLILQMEIKKDGCPTGQMGFVLASKIVCLANSTAAYSKYDLTLRTDNPNTSYYLFVDGVQLAKGVTSPLSSILVCGKTSSHAWEDGGGWDRQDFFYTAKTTCAPSGQNVVLTK
ncbi:TadE/TadG family type IV pilus assembly protein [Neorhizobium sp. NCHU2750]|uniref:pilus assembly protein TadG-related protein n=1 Tax=Neorhizobium sp. NCHU2750 TaxID=1825976 RepID=UPI000E766D58|nr:hypothetical protein NCHU2750_01610 [Neorhizobium sp. NCHU2750]